MRTGAFGRIAPALAAVVAAGVVAIADGAVAAEGRTSLLLLPVASGSPGQDQSAKALGAALEDGFSSISALRLVSGAARETALRELSSTETIAPEEFLAVCRRAGADLAVLGGSSLDPERLALELRIFDVAGGRELDTFRGEGAPAKAFDLAAAAIRHTIRAAGLPEADVRFPRGTTASLEAYAAYRAALAEESAAARTEKLRSAVALDPSFLDATLRLGAELFRGGQLDEALGVLERAAALGPKVAEARNNFGVALAAAGRHEQAQREFEEAVALAPGYAEARLNLARVLEDRGLESDAERQYAAVLEADAANDKARFGLAVLYDRTGRPELAIKEFRQLSARRPDLAEAEFIRVGQEARKARDFARAEKYFLRAVDVNPQLAAAWAELGTNSHLAGEFTKSVEYFRKALAIEPGQGAYHYSVALGLEKVRRPDDALAEYRRAVELGGPPEARLGLARAALDAGDPAVAVEELNLLLAASPDHAEAKTMLARATAEMEGRRRLLEGQSQFANERLQRLEQIVADANRANRELEARVLALGAENRELEAGLAELEARGAEAPQLRAELEQLRAGLASQRADAERAAAAERERAAERVAMLETQAGSQAEALKAREQELAAALARERESAAELAKVRGELALLAERQAAVEARSAAATRALAERDQALEKSRLTVRDLALELGRLALRDRSWEKAIAYLEIVVDLDPRSGEAWYGLGEARFQRGEYEKSRQMYRRAKEIY